MCALIIAIVLLSSGFIKLRAVVMGRSLFRSFMSYNEIQHNSLQLWIEAITKTEEPCIDTNLKEITNKFLSDMFDYKQTLVAIEKVMQKQKLETETTSIVYKQTYLCDKCHQEFKSEHFPDRCPKCLAIYNF